MKRTISILAAMVALLMIGPVAHAATVYSLVGDKDGFGIPGAPAVPADGTLFVTGLGGAWFGDYRGANDLATAPFTDVWGSLGTLSYTHSYSLGGEDPISAKLYLQIAGIHDVNGTTAYPVKADTLEVGQIAYNSAANASQMIKLYAFDIPLSLIDGSNALQITVPAPDGYAVNYSELVIETAPPAIPIPLPPAAWGGLGIMAVGACLRHLRRRRAMN